MDCGTVPRSESNDDNEIIANTYRQLKDIIALYETKTITKYNLVKETKDFWEDCEEIILFYEKRCLDRTENISINDFKMFHIIVTCAAHGALNLHPF